MKTILLMVGLLVSQMCYSQGTYFNTEIQFPESQKVTKAIQGSDGNYYAIGSLKEKLYPIWTKLDDEGEIIWSQHYSSKEYQKPVDIIESETGDFLITGSVKGENKSSIYVIRFNINGEILSNKIYQIKSESSTCHTQKIFLKSDATYCVLSYSNGINHPVSNVLLIEDSDKLKYDVQIKNLYLLPVKRVRYTYPSVLSIPYRQFKQNIPACKNTNCPHYNYLNPEFLQNYPVDKYPCYPVSITTSETHENFLHAGNLRDDSSNMGNEVYVYSKQNEEISWIKTYGIEGQSVVANDILSFPSGGALFLCTIKYGNEKSSDLWLLRLNESGDILWTQKYDNYTYEYGASVSTCEDKSIIISYTSSGIDMDTNIVVMKVDSSGNMYSPPASVLTNEGDMDSFFLFPNPAVEKLQISLRKSDTKSDISIYSVQGKRVYSNTTSGSKPITIDCSSWTSGIYFVVGSIDDKVVSKRFVKQ